MALNFTPGETVPLSATVTGASVSFSLAQASSDEDVMVTNAGPAMAFVGFGGAANLPAIGATNATPVPAGAIMMLRKGGGVTQCSAITAAGTATLYFTSGAGE